MRWNPFKKKEVPPIVEEPVQYEISNKVTDEVKSSWRNNMWVMTPKGLGIIFAIGHSCHVHLVNEHGETINGLICSFQDLRQARYLEIPANRRGDKDVANRLGYV